MPRRSRAAALLLAVSGGILLAVFLRHALVRPNGFTAELVRSSTPVLMPCTIYVKGQNVRREHAIAVTSDSRRIGIGGITIARVPVKTVNRARIEIVNVRAKARWVMEPAQGTYYEEGLSTVDLPYAAEATRSLIGTWRVGQTMQHLGSEDVNGYRCEKIVAETGGARITRWHSPRLDFDLRREVVKTSQGQQAQMEEYRVKQCDLPDSLFEVPKRYRKVAAPTVP